MSVLRVYVNLRRRSARFARILMVLAAGGAVGQAQTPPYAEFQYSTLTASGNTITATMLPVVTSTGISYFNVVVEFDVAANGTLTVAPGYPTVAKAPRPLIGNFLAGSYVGPATDSSYDMTLRSPDRVLQLLALPSGPWLLQRAPVVPQHRPAPLGTSSGAQ
jgi:hypothetical protein